VLRAQGDKSSDEDQWRVHSDRSSSVRLSTTNGLKETVTASGVGRTCLSEAVATRLNDRIATSATAARTALVRIGQ
jgi:hypothetical protein